MTKMQACERQSETQRLAAPNKVTAKEGEKR